MASSMKSGWLQLSGSLVAAAALECRGERWIMARGVVVPWMRRGCVYCVEERDFTLGKSAEGRKEKLRLFTAE